MQDRNGVEIKIDDLVIVRARVASTWPDEDGGKVTICVMLGRDDARSGAPFLCKASAVEVVDTPEGHRA